MSLDPIQPYSTVVALKDVLHIEQTDTSSDSDLTLALQEGAEMIVDYCHRDFHLETETRVWDAPPGENLLVDDLMDVTSIAVWGNTLTTPEYYVQPVRLAFAYSRVVRLDTSTPPLLISWDTGIAGRSRLGAIEITGVWAFDAVNLQGTWVEKIPARVSRVNLILASRLWNMKDVLYTGQGGGAAVGRKPVSDGLWTPDVAALLNVFVRQPIGLVVSA